MKSISLTGIVLFLTFILSAQISINTDGSDADNSAILDVQSTEKGLLLPRLSTTEMNAIQSPASGLMIYNTDFKRIMYFNGQVWASPCDEFICGMPFIDERDGKTYKTVKIGDQCWMAENLNVGTQNTGTHTDDGQIEKYCYENMEAKCDQYGGLYMWDELMEYYTSEGIQGICPKGWHIPTDYEWCNLENFVDQSTVSCTISGWRGIDCGLVLKSTSGWLSGGNGTDLFSFNALAGGQRLPTSPPVYGGEYQVTDFWSSTEITTSSSWSRGLSFQKDNINRFSNHKTFASYCRCVKD